MHLRWNLSSLEYFVWISHRCIGKNFVFMNANTMKVNPRLNLSRIVKDLILFFICFQPLLVIKSWCLIFKQIVSKHLGKLDLVEKKIRNVFPNWTGVMEWVLFFFFVFFNWVSGDVRFSHAQRHSFAFD